MSILKRILKSLVILIVLTIIFISPSHAGDIGKLTETDDLVIEGQKEFQQRCAVCHGTEGKGDGPYSFALVFKPADLTKLLIANEGHFPFIETYLTIDGRDMNKYHGTRLMPIWGDRYSQETWSSVSPEHASTLVRGRIFELLMYLYSIQDPAL
ncbi:MAG: cytochrome c [Gammaproteobacteria bacterium]|nr:cytochrome c [Gammaproteobacteria bacterium]